jgi:hypothetical protein
VKILSLENLVALDHISEDHTLLRKSSHTHVVACLNDTIRGFYIYKFTTRNRRIDCTIVRVIEPQRLLVVLHNRIFKGTYLT